MRESLPLPKIPMLVIAFLQGIFRMAFWPAPARDLATQQW